MKRWAGLGMTLAIIMMCGTQYSNAVAATRNWTGTNSGLWSDGGNWGGTQISAGDDLVFPAGASNKSNTNAAVPTVTVPPPSIAKAFGAATIPLNGSTTLQFTIANPDSALGLTGVTFTDTLPGGLVVASPNGLTGTCGAGTITATAGSGTVTLTAGTLAASGSCVVGVNVTGTTLGVKNNSVAVSSTETGAGNTSTATVTVVVPATATIAKQFGTPTIFVGGSTTLTFTLTNPNLATTLTGVAFTDVLPGGLTVSTPNGLTGSCGTGSISAAAGAGSISLTAGSIAANTACTFAVNVTATGAGAQNNVTGTVTSSEGGTGGTASASVFVAGAVVPATVIPTLQAWAVALLGLLLTISAGLVLRRKTYVRR